MSESVGGEFVCGYAVVCVGKWVVSEYVLGVCVSE